MTTNPTQVERVAKAIYESVLEDTYPGDGGHDASCCRDMALQAARAALEAMSDGVGERERLREELAPLLPYHGKTNSYGKREALLAATRTLRESYERRKCDNDGVADCIRCNVMFLVSTVEQLIDRAALSQEPQAPKGGSA